MGKVLFSAESSRYKAVIYLRDSTSKTFYSLIEEDTKNAQKSLIGMERRLINTIYRGKYNTALIYDRGELVRKYVRGVREV